MYFTTNNIKFTNQLLNWFYSNKRNLPWRKTNDPYKIWISEVMLQQTKVDTVIPYYNKWIILFPTIEHVAKANLDLLLKCWEGLGYYRRCINFYKSCTIIVNDNNGKIPTAYYDFIKLPGVGKYTASAVLSIAYGAQIPVLDGNVKRVISRILKFDQFIEKGDLFFIQYLNKIIPKNYPGSFNEGLMELGSQICKKVKPLCNQCPISNYCNSYKDNSQNEYPKIKIRKKPPLIEVVAGIIWNKKNFYIQKRVNKKHLANLWEFPGGKLKKNENLENALKREIKEEVGANIIIKSKINKIIHKYSGFSIELTLYNCILKGSINTNYEYKWIKPREINLYAFPKANHKLFKYIEEIGWNKFY